MPLIQFDEKAICPKCGGPDVGMQYCNTTHSPAEFGYDVAVEHLHRQCQRCGFIWLEACRDNTQIEAATADPLTTKLQ